MVIAKAFYNESNVLLLINYSVRSKKCSTVLQWTLSSNQNLKSQTNLRRFSGSNQYGSSSFAAAKGNADAQCDLGMMYGMGKGVAKNYTESIKWLRLAANQGFAPALNALHVLHVSGY